MYKPVDNHVDFPKMEEAILAFWERERIFEKSLDGKAADWTFYDGPPFATGLPHFGHFVPSTIKDIIPRYQTMRGRRVERRFGWDCHGLPVENLIEKELGLNSKTDIEKFGIAKFNEACRASVLRYVAEWRAYITRLGRWVDFDNDYKTMEADYMESIWWIMKQLWDKGLIYEGHYILPYCPRCATVLSNHEVAGSFKDVHDPAITVRFKLTTKLTNNANTYFLAWTTTPWTLPSNQALTVGPDIDYVCVEDGGEHYILAEGRLSSYYKSPDDYRIIWKKKGAELLGIEYEPLFPYFKDLAAKGAFRTYAGDFVSTEDGTGIVHTASGFGEDDARVLSGSGVPVVCPVDAECRFTKEVWDYEGVFVKDADKAIMERLKAEGKLVKREQILHSYPHCWRCDHPLIYRAVGSWFVNVQKIKETLLAANNEITWVPAHIKAGRFGKWLEGARDWAISRSRYWGNPLPIWRCPDCGKMVCVGSRAELQQLAGLKEPPADLHKHFVDEITIPCAKCVSSSGLTGGSHSALKETPGSEPGGDRAVCTGTMRRVPEVLDCWFESGAMPYAQQHYPFENKDYFESHFPADFISEGLDQTRGWFYSLTVLAAALAEKPAFRNCIVSGLVLASDGKKMSKSLRNYTDPMEAVNRFGADALRLFLIHSAVVKADDLRYSDEGVRDVMKSILIPLWNAYSFFVTYANIDSVEPSPPPEHPSNPLDIWILSAAQSLVKNVTAALDAYDLSRAVDPILSFIDNLNNWYIRRSRRRFWRSTNDSDKMEAYAVLSDVLLTLVKVAAPFMPFTTEEMYQNLARGADKRKSVHLCDWPRVDEKRIESDLEFRMATAQHAVSMGRALRSQYNIKVRQPLRAAELVTRNAEEKKALLEMEDIIREELNVKQVVLRDNEEALVEYGAKANFRVLGKELGKDMKAAAERIAQLSQEEIQSLLDGATLALDVAGRTVEITADKLDIRRNEKAHLRVINEGTLTVGLDTEVTAELEREGAARDLVRGVQNERKESGLDVTDRIVLRVSVNGSADSSAAASLRTAFDEWRDFIAKETLAADIAWLDAPTDGMKSVEAGEAEWLVSVAKK